MASNSFGQIFKITTWGESHGKAIGVVIDGCPAGLALTEDDINAQLAWRAPGRNAYTSPRREPDRAEILSGLFEGQTTGAPISIIIWNQDVDNQAYEPIKGILRPGHANFTYMQKYGCFDHRGGGRASGRETACRVAAGAVAKKLLSDHGVVVMAYLQSTGKYECCIGLSDVEKEGFHNQIRQSPVFCPCVATTTQILAEIETAKNEGDSLGGIVEAVALHVPVGWGDPIYEKLEANLAKAMLSIPASKGFEIGSGFGSVLMKGSEHNDRYHLQGNDIQTATNHAGGTLGGISTGMPLQIRVPFKPTSSIRKEQQTLTLDGKNTTMKLPEGSRHDPCLAIRAVPVVEAMLALVLVDAMLMNHNGRLQKI